MNHYYWLVLYVYDGSGNIGSRAFSLPCSPWPLEFGLLIFSLFWVQWVMPQTVAGLLACWKGRFGRCRNINLGHDITLSFVEHLKVEKCRHFEDCENSVLYLKFSLVKSLFEWVNAFGPYSWCNMFKVIDSCSFCT